MNTRKLISMTDYVNLILAYVKESQNHKRAIELIEWYADFISKPLNIDMFKGDNALFPNFNIVKNSNEATINHYINSVSEWENGAFATTLYRKSEYSKAKSRCCFITSYHLKTIEDLCDKEINYNLESEYIEINLFEEKNCTLASPFDRKVVNCKAVCLNGEFCLYYK